MVKTNRSKHFGEAFLTVSSVAVLRNIHMKVVINCPDSKVNYDKGLQLLKWEGFFCIIGPDDAGAG
jgi:hypothetical protein